MLVKTTHFFTLLLLLCASVSAQSASNKFGWDLTYSAVLESNKIGSRTWIRKWVASEYKSPARKWISEWQGEPIESSILIEYPAFHAAERTTMWIFRTKDNAYYWQDIEKAKFSNTKKDVELKAFDELLSQVSSWQQAKPFKVRNNNDQAIPGYLGFLSIYDKGKLRQILLSMEDFIMFDNRNPEKMKPGRLLKAIDPVIPKPDTDF